MIILRCYNALGEAVIEGSAHMRHDGSGNPTEPWSLFLGRLYRDATSSISSDDLAIWLAAWFADIDQQIAEEAGGWNSLL